MRKIATEAGLSPTRAHQLTSDVDLPTLEEALGALCSCGWSAPEDPDSSDDEELAGRALVADRLDDKVGCCATAPSGWTTWNTRRSRRRSTCALRATIPTAAMSW